MNLYEENKHNLHSITISSFKTYIFLP